uniref:Uncharacterized protein n=1 Tax=Glossina austeni TaxID=7395 RepID=A0A1A9UE97_GLOAU
MIKAPTVAEKDSEEEEKRKDPQCGCSCNSSLRQQLTKHKYIAIVNNFGDTEETCSQLEMDGGLDGKPLLKNNPSSYNMEDKLPIITRRQEVREIQSIKPEGTIGHETLQHLDYKTSDCTESKRPLICTLNETPKIGIGHAFETDCLTVSVPWHYLMDETPILPPLFLDICPGDRVVDACAAPLCNDLMESRDRRLREAMKSIHLSSI